ncbi:MAG TPA: uroporphyrinogen-III synthase [Rhizomicrobium sp.]|nr:uroporphyrinogen-III synthase [Rhizomicrobium sp.]
MRVLVTRPIEDALRTAERLKARGHEAVVAPLLSVSFRSGPEIPLDDVQAVLVTSANGVRALAQRTPRRDIPVFAVGDQTAAAAREAGFSLVNNAEGDARALASAAARWAKSGRGTLLHASGADGGGALTTSLREQGFQTQKMDLYDIVPARDIPQELRERIGRGEIGAALFFSPRSARVFRDCATAARLDLGAMTAVCISQAAKSALAPLALRDIRVAARPDMDAILDRLES